jgi:hypothetical protein
MSPLITTRPTKRSIPVPGSGSSKGPLFLSGSQSPSPSCGSTASPDAASQYCVPRPYSTPSGIAGPTRASGSHSSSSPSENTSNKTPPPCSARWSCSCQACSTTITGYSHGYMTATAPLRCLTTPSQTVCINSCGRSNMCISSWMHWTKAPGTSTGGTCFKS